MKLSLEYRPRSLAMLVFLCMALQNPAQAATTLPDIGSLPRINPAPATPAITRPEIRQKQESPYPAAMPETAGLTITVQRVVFSGNRHISSVTLAALLKPNLGQAMGLKELKQLSDTITTYYRKHGYLLAQAYFPEQDIADNTLTMVVIEGYLGALKVETPDQLDQPFLTEMAMHDLTMQDAIKESNLVRNITVLNALPGLSAISELSPGAQVGYSDANIELQALPLFTGYAGVDTFGNRFTGRKTLFAGLFLNNLAGRGDRFGAHLKDSTDERQRSAQFDYSVPIHASGTLLNLGAGYADYRLGGVFSSLGASGHSWYSSAYLDHPTIRARQGNLTSRLGFSHKGVSDDVSAFSLKNQRNIHALELGLFGDWRDTQWNGFNQLGLNVKLGKVDFKNKLAQNLDDTGAKTDGVFVKYNIFASRIQALNAAYNLTLSAEYQGATQNLDSSEKLAIGGINRWREFGELPVSADRGLIIGAEIRRTMQPLHNMASFLRSLEQSDKLKNIELSPYVFLDMGEGLINHQALSDDNQVRSTHYGAGVDVLLTKYWTLDLVVSNQISKIEGLNKQSETRAWGQMSVAF